MRLTRRTFLEMCGIGSAALAGCKGGSRALEPAGPVTEIDNPLASYPDRDWEKVYLDQYRYDSSFTWVCSPNCTHECRMRAFVRNGVMIRAEQNYDSHRITDLDGNTATAAWSPRGCSNGFSFQRRVYGPNRLRHPVIRKGWKQWADDGFPELDAAARAKYKFDARGTDELARATWDEAFGYAAKAMVAIARRYSGDDGKRRLLAAGYPPEMLEHWDGAGTRTFKLRGGMGVLGVTGKYGMYRFGNMLALLDAKLRGVGPEAAKGARNWSNYTWHGDQAPGHPFVHGLQTSDCDLSDLRATKLHVHLGKNLIENKRADNHFFSEVMERGGKIVVVAPEYSPSATKADYWIPVRPGTDAALLLGVTKLMIDEGSYDAAFVKQFTDFPLLVRTDTLARLKAEDVFPGYEPPDLSDRPSMKIYGLTAEQRAQLGDFVVWDAKAGEPRAVTRDDVGAELAARGIDPALEGSYTVRLASGKAVKVMPLFELYKSHHLRDYDLATVAEICQSPPELIRRLAHDLATIKPAAVHIGEGLNHWFHATETNRATYLPLMLTGNIGKPGAGSHTWAGNYKAGFLQGSAAVGPGFKGWVAEDPWHLNLDPNADGKDIHAHAYSKDEEVAYWNYGDQPLIVNTPRGRKVFTGKTHLPTPTRLMWFTNVNLINNAKWAYEMIKNIDPQVELIMSTDIELTGSIEYSDIGLPATSWVESGSLEITSSCSSPWFQIWKGGIAPVYEGKDDIKILAEMAVRLGQEIDEPRMADMWKFALEGKSEVYIQRMLDSSVTARGYKVAEIMAGKHGEPGAALCMYRTYPRIPFYEQIHESHAFFTPTGRLQAYNDEPEVIEYGENFVVHREGPEATPYLPNVIVSSNPYVRPDSYGISPAHMGAGERQVRNIKMSWAKVKGTSNPLWKQGYQFYCLTPKTRHSTHSSWYGVDWHLIWNSGFADPYRADKRHPGVAEHTLHVNPQAARDLGIDDGDYVFVDANPADRPYVGARPSDPFYKVARVMLRVKYNPAYPYNVLMMKHGAWIATDRTVKAHETRPDGRAVSENNYQATFRYGSQQSITRGWAMPMHQLDSLFHKMKAKQGFMFGGEADNHGINTVPKETLVKITKAEPGGLGGVGPWETGTRGITPDGESELFAAYLRGELTKVEG